MTFNYFQGNTFTGAGAWAFDRSKMLNGQAATAVNFTTTSAYGGLLASDLDGSALPPAGSPNYFAAVDTPVDLANAPLPGSTLQIWKFHVDWTTPSNSTFGTATHTPNYNLTVPSYRWGLCGGSRNCIAQPGTSAGLDAIGDRLMNRLQYRRFADGHESLMANHTVGVGTSGDQAAIRWYEIRALSTTPIVYQQGTYSPSTDNRWMGSIAMDRSGDIAVGYSVSSSTVSPSIRYTGRLASDTLGTLPQGETTMIAGSGSQTSGYNRWGDYSMMAVDPTDDCTFWYTQEYYTATSDRGWRTRIGSFKFPNCGTPWLAAYNTAATPTNWTPGQTLNYTVTVTNSGTQTWPSTGASWVDLSVKFTATGGGNGKSPYYTDQRFVLPNDVAPGGSVTLTMSVTAPTAKAGSLVLEYQMVKEYQFFFNQFADVSVTVSPLWSASYGVNSTPTIWTTGQTLTYTVIVTNNGTQTWPSTGASWVDLSVKFTATGGGNGKSPYYTDQRFALPNDVVPGGSVTLNISVTAPTAKTGSLVLEYQVVKEYQFFFSQYADVNVTVT
jgi:hypothetical protein